MIHGYVKFQMWIYYWNNLCKFRPACTWNLNKYAWECILYDVQWNIMKYPRLSKGLFPQAVVLGRFYCNGSAKWNLVQKKQMQIWSQSSFPDDKSANFWVFVLDLQAISWWFSILDVKDINPMWICILHTIIVRKEDGVYQSKHQVANNDAKHMNQHKLTLC